MTVNANRTEIEMEVKKLQKTAEKRQQEIEKKGKEHEKETIIIPAKKRRKTEKTEYGIWGNKILDQGFTLIPNALIENFTDIGLTHTHMIIIIAMMRFSHRGSRPFPAQKTLEQITGLSDRTIQKAIKEMKGMGYLTIQKRYKERIGNGVKRTTNRYNYNGIIGKITQVNNRE